MRLKTNLVRWKRHREAKVATMVVAAKSEGATEVSAEEGAALAEDNGCLFAETSSRDNRGVVEAFRRLGARALECQESAAAAREEERAAVSLAQKKSANKGCC